MKKYNLPSHIPLLLLAASISLPAACTGDDPSNPGALPAGKHPITLATTVEGIATTRTTVEGTWKGGEDIIGTLSKDDGSLLHFYGTMNSDGTSQLTDTNRNPLYWENADEEYKISARYPIDFRGVKIDQRLLADHLASDQLLGEGPLSFGSRDPLPFKHLMAKLTVVLKAGEGITDLSAAVVTFLSGIGAPSAGLAIIPYQNATALFPPQQLSPGMPLIRIDLNNIVYIYTPASPTEAYFEAGKSYLYTVTVNKTGLTVELKTLPTWGNSGATEEVASKQLDPNFVITNLKVGDYYYSDGTWSDGGYRKYTDGSNGRLPVDPQPGMVCIGIVFQTDSSRISQSDRNKGYNAYVMALADAGEPASWGADTDEHSDATYQDHVFDTNTNQLARMYTEQEGLRATRFIIDKYSANDSAVLKAQYKAFYNVSQFGKIPATQSLAAPPASSGWFLPSSGQWCSILEMLGNRDMVLIASGLGSIISLDDQNATRDNLNQWLTHLTFAQPFTFSGYWTTTELAQYNVYVIGFYYELRLYNGNKNDATIKTRCILAF